ncbi:berberine bridge enzyme-like protein 8 [Tanacetum coccineum]|uniref:Berberine bridge enzyme-like protein 8 n=1 Tax=Tanacetum coccineum TaxID=301880 RepID=A0ABQ4X088_9ASTR
MIELERPVLTFNPYGGRMAEISEFAKPFPHRAGNIAKIQYATDRTENGVDIANHYKNLTRVLHKHITPFVSKYPREAFLNYRDLDIGATNNGKNSFLEGTVYGIKYFKKTNFMRLVKVKTRVDFGEFSLSLKQFRPHRSFKQSCFGLPGDYFPEYNEATYIAIINTARSGDNPYKLPSYQGFQDTTNYTSIAI